MLVPFWDNKNLFVNCDKSIIIPPTVLKKYFLYRTWHSNEINFQLQNIQFE